MIFIRERGSLFSVLPSFSSSRPISVSTQYKYLFDISYFRLGPYLFTPFFLSFFLSRRWRLRSFVLSFFLPFFLCAASAGQGARSISFLCSLLWLYTRPIVAFQQLLSDQLPLPSWTSTPSTAWLSASSCSPTPPRRKWSPS